MCVCNPNGTVSIVTRLAVGDPVVVSVMRLACSEISALCRLICSGAASVSMPPASLSVICTPTAC